MKNTYGFARIVGTRRTTWRASSLELAARPRARGRIRHVTSVGVRLAVFAGIVREFKMEKIEEFWLCADCTQAAVNDDLSGLDYHLSPSEAEEKANRIKAGLNLLGNIVTDYGDCPDDKFTRRDWIVAVQNDETDASLQDWQDAQILMYDNGEEEFSRKTCDCCGDNLLGTRFRFARLGEPA